MHVSVKVAKVGPTCSIIGPAHHVKASSFWPTTTLRPRRAVIQFYGTRVRWISASSFTAFFAGVRTAILFEKGFAGTSRKFSGETSNTFSTIQNPPRHLQTRFSLENNTCRMFTGCFHCTLFGPSCRLSCCSRVTIRCCRRVIIRCGAFPPFVETMEG